MKKKLKKKKGGKLVGKREKLVKKTKLKKTSEKLVKNYYITEQQLGNLKNQISKVITKSKYLDQDAEDGL